MFIQTRVWVYLCLSIRLSMLSFRTRRLVQVSVCVCVCGCVFHHHQDITRMHTLIGYPLQALSTLCCLICRKFCLRMPAPFWKSSPRCQRNHTSRKKPGGFLNVTGAKCKDGGNNPSCACKQLVYTYCLEYILNLPLCLQAARVPLTLHLPISFGFRFLRRGVCGVLNWLRSKERFFRLSNAILLEMIHQSSPDISKRLNVEALPSSLAQLTLSIMLELECRKVSKTDKEEQ